MRIGSCHTGEQNVRTIYRLRLKIMQLANQEAQRFNHEYIGTEHILLELSRKGPELPRISS